METENSIREEIGERAEGAFPEEGMSSGFPPQEEPSAAAAANSYQPQAEPEGMNESAGNWEPAGSSYGGGPSDEPPGGGKGDKKSFLRASGSWTDILPIAAILSVLVLLFGEIISSLLVRFVIPFEAWGLKHLGDADSVQFLLQYFSFIGIWIVFMLVISVFKNNWPMWKAFFYNGHGNNLKAIPAGILIGFGLNGLCILISCIMGDIKLSFNEFNPLLFFVFLLCVMIQSGAEEIVDRCYLYQKLRRRYRWPVIAILGNSLVFMALHMGNPGVTAWGLGQVFLIGVLFSLIVYYWDSLWTVIWAHTAWNFSQSIVFGLPNSGIVSKYSVFKLEAASARDGLFYNTGFGVEGSKGANALIAAIIVIVLIYGLVTKRGEKKDYWEELEELEAGKNHIWEAVILTVIMVSVLAAGIFVGWWVNAHQEEIAQFTEQMEQQLNEEEPGAEAPAVEQPVGQEQPGAEVPAVEQPAGQEQQPGTETPAVEQPAGQEQQPGAEAPAAEQPAAQEQPSVQEQPAAEQLPEQGSPVL